MTTSWKEWSGAASVLILALILVVLDVTDASVGHWFTGHAFTTSVVGGLLVLLLTVLIVDRVVNVRQLRDRSRAIAAQAAIVMPQAERASKSVSAMLDGSGDRESATDEVRTYMMMLLISAPVLIDARVSRTFLEAAQQLAGEFAHALAVTARKSAVVRDVTARLDAAVRQLRAASAPLLQILDLEQLLAVSSEEAESEGSEPEHPEPEDIGVDPDA